MNENCCYPSHSPSTLYSVRTILVSGYQPTKFIILFVDTYHRIGTTVIHAKKFAYMQCTKICVFDALKEAINEYNVSLLTPKHSNNW
jgi:hypothetical protein